MNSDGSLTFGPLVVETTDGVYDAVANGSFLYVSVGSKGEAGNHVQRAGLYRIDLGTNLNNQALRFASAPDLVAPAATAGACNQVTSVGDKLWFSVDGTGVFQQATTYVSEGWVETGRIRYSTVEPKAWRDIRIITEEDSVGMVAAYATTIETGAPSTWNTIVQTSTGIYDTAGSLVATAGIPVTSLYVAFNIVRSADTATTPVFIGWQVRAIPAPRRSQLIQIPLMCFDKETDKQGVRFGTEGGSWQRYSLLKTLELNASTVSWHDYTTGESAEGYIEQVTFHRTNPPSRQTTGVGGIVTVTLRLVG
jgi:hypothetical protein